MSGSIPPNHSRLGLISHPADLALPLPPPPQPSLDGLKNPTPANSDTAQSCNDAFGLMSPRPRNDDSTAASPSLISAGLSSSPDVSPATPTSTKARDDDISAHHPHVSVPLPVTAASVASDSDSLQLAGQSRGHSHHGHGHRKSKSAIAIEPVPRQTILKALASVARNNKPQALSLNSMLSAHSAAKGGDNRPSSASSQQLCDALNGLAQAQNARPTAALTPTAAFPSLQSPCFYHTRFDDAVDIDKVLEEIKNDEWMSHSRLVQTATGVREVSKQLQRRPIKRAVRNVMIVTKARDNQLVLLTRELALWLLRTPRYGSDLGVNVYVDAKLRHSKRFDARGITDENPRFHDMLKYWTPDLCWSQPERFDLVLTLGGDGTVLFTSWLFQRIVPPVLSFSLGSLGFLTSFEFERYKDHLNRVMGDEGMRVNLRMRFTCTVYRDGPMGHEMEEGEQFEVLNELVIDRGPSPYVSNLELYGDNELLTVVQADGCIFSTPTGRFPPILPRPSLPPSLRI